MKKKRTTKQQVPKIPGYLELPGLFFQFDTILYFRYDEFTKHYLLRLKNESWVILNKLQYDLGVEKFVSAVERTVKLDIIYHKNLTFVRQDMVSITFNQLANSGIIRFFNDNYIVLTKGEYDEILEIISLQNRTPSSNRSKKKANQ